MWCTHNSLFFAIWSVETTVEEKGIYGEESRLGTRLFRDEPEEESESEPLPLSLPDELSLSLPDSEPELDLLVLRLVREHELRSSITRIGWRTHRLDFFFGGSFSSLSFPFRSFSRSSSIRLAVPVLLHVKFD